MSGTIASSTKLIPMGGCHDIIAVGSHLGHLQGGGGGSELFFAKSTKVYVCGWLIGAYTAVGKALTLPFVVSLLQQQQQQQQQKTLFIP